MIRLAEALAALSPATDAGNGSRLWTFGPDGKAVAFRHHLDSAKHIAAVLQPSGVA